MTRAEHVRWCKQRAIDEMTYSKDPKQGVISMMSDLGKHPETAGGALQSLCMMQLLSQRMTEQDVRKFIDGFAE